MSTETLTRFYCDAPRCPANGIGKDSITPPDGWTKLKSTAHIPVTESIPRHGRRNSRTLSYGEQCYGGFSLHLCPEHPTAFADHQPITTGYGYKSNVQVSCSCGANLGTAPAVTMAGRYPSSAIEAAWFHHLPVDLRWYLWRGQRQWATRTLVHGVERIQQHLTEQRARDAAASSTSLYYTSEVVYRDGEEGPWVGVPVGGGVESAAG